ncbi:hypothetical protein SNEBB_006666 [Seison nebaliae]|nr:hypothetical protein SNEBB_006666 [Seison nebaliae]
MLMSKLKSKKTEKSKKQSKKDEHDFLDYVDRRDYLGAKMILQVQREKEVNLRSPKKLLWELDMWIGYVLFHLGEYEEAGKVYDKLSRTDISEPVLIYLACCYFMQGMYPEAEAAAKRFTGVNQLQVRVLFHCAHKTWDDEKLFRYHKKLMDQPEDQLCLGSMHYMRYHYREAIDVYKKLLLNYQNFKALNIYIALCYYKIDSYEMSMELLNSSIPRNDVSLTASILKAAVQYRLYGPEQALKEMNMLQDTWPDDIAYGKPLIKHNIAVYEAQEDAITTFDSALEEIPEARLNATIYHVQHDKIDEAYELMQNAQQTQTIEMILKGITYYLYGSKHNNAEDISHAEYIFQSIGESETDCDTVPGRQSMASYCFLKEDFKNCELYLDSISNYMKDNDTFNYNYAQVKLTTKKFSEAKEIFLDINSNAIKQDYVYALGLARCYIYDKDAEQAWRLYEERKNTKHAFALLQLIGNDCYKSGQFYYAVRAFDRLEQLEPNIDHFDGKMGAVAGLFQFVISTKSDLNYLKDCVKMLQVSGHQLALEFAAVIENWFDQL